MRAATGLLIDSTVLQYARRQRAAARPLPPHSVRRRQYDGDAVPSGVLPHAEEARVILPPPPPPPPPPGSPPMPVQGPAWYGYDRDAQHTGESDRIADLRRHLVVHARRPRAAIPPGGAPLTHYGSPVVTTNNTVVILVKTGPGGGYRIEGRDGVTGVLLWSAATDYLHAAAQLAAALQRAAHPAGPPLCARRRGQADRARRRGRRRQHARNACVLRALPPTTANPAAFDSTVVINTPVTSMPMAMSSSASVWSPRTPLGW